MTMMATNLSKPDLYLTILDLQGIIADRCNDPEYDMASIEHYLDERHRMYDEFAPLLVKQEIEYLLKEAQEAVQALGKLLKTGTDALSFVIFKSIYERDVLILTKLLKPKAQNLNKPDEPI